MNMLREDIRDKVLIDLIKKYLKSGVMGNGLLVRTEESSPKRKHPKRLLGYCRKWNTNAYHYKQKTCTPWIL